MGVNLNKSYVPYIMKNMRINRSFMNMNYVKCIFLPTNSTICSKDSSICLKMNTF